MGNENKLNVRLRSRRRIGPRTGPEGSRNGCCREKRRGAVRDLTNSATGIRLIGYVAVERLEGGKSEEGGQSHQRGESNELCHG